MSIDWDKAPADATDYFPGNYQYSAHWAKKGFYCVEGFEKEGWREDRSPLSASKFYARPAQQPKQWSGPQDGLPPVNSVCEFVSSDTSWGKVKIIAHDDGKVVFKPSGDSYYGITPDHKAVFRPFIDPEQQRETAIREIMDIADVDCRVTAARLVDAGFKR